MTSSVLPAVFPVFLRILADRRGTPAALLLDGAGPLDPELVARSAAMTARMPGLFAAGRPEAERLLAAGWRVMEFGAVAKIDGVLVPDQLPPGVLLIDGDWCLQAPAKPAGAQAASRALALQLLEKVAKDADTHEIEDLLRQDPALSYQLLRVVNSIGVGGSRRINSFAQALMILGRQQLRRWLNLMLFAAQGSAGDVRSGMLLARVALRARSMELLAREQGCDRLHQEQAFMAGMFSLLGALFGMPLAEVLAPLSLGHAVEQALLAHAGELGALLALIAAAEQGQDIAVRLAALQLEPAVWNGALLEASGWMLDAVRDSQGSTRG